MPSIYSFGLADVLDNGRGYFNESNTRKLKATTLEDARKEAMSWNWFGKNAVIHLFKHGEIFELWNYPTMSHPKGVKQWVRAQEEQGGNDETGFDRSDLDIAKWLREDAIDS